MCVSLPSMWVKWWRKSEAIKPTLRAAQPQGRIIGRTPPRQLGKRRRYHFFCSYFFLLALALAQRAL